MPNRQLNATELEKLFSPLLAGTRERLNELSGGDPELLWALRRKLAKELSYDERGKPMHRRALKAYKRGEQGNRCARCACELPDKYVVLDRLAAMGGYTKENTRLLCRECDSTVQEERGFA